jgi:hypothetical protein
VPALLAASCLAAPVARGAAAYGEEGGSAGVSVRVLAGPDGAAPSGVIDALEAAGWQVHVVLLPSTFYATETARARALPAGVRRLGGAAALLPCAVPVPRADTAPGSEDPFGGSSDVVLPDAPDASARSAVRAPIAPIGAEPPPGLPSGSRWEDTSEFMIGRVAVPILFPESDGTVDRNHFDWTPALRDSVVRAAVRGFLKWSLMAATRNIPLTFLIETHSGLATKYEPIDRTIGEEGLWIEDALEPLLGYRGDPVAMAYELANAARARLSTQWAALAFAVQNDTLASGRFPDGYIAHSRLGGPWFVIPVNNLNSQSASLDYYFEHEVTHQFWALDEYPWPNAWWSCNLTTGYFSRPNWNATVPAPNYCGIPTVNCLMKGNYPDNFCDYTMEQVGWVDLDQSGILDLYETRPTVRPDSTQYRTGAGLAITLRGYANETAFPNRNPYRFGAGDSISIAVIDSIQYRLDGGPWNPIPCGDGLCDSGEEPFTLVLPPPAPGTHAVEWRAWNSSAKTAAIPSSTVLTISGASGGIPAPGPGGAPQAPRITVAPVPARGSARLTLQAAPLARGTARIIDASGRTLRRWEIAVPGDGRLAWSWDGQRAGGGDAPAGLYFLVVNLGPDTATRRVVLLR